MDDVWVETVHEAERRDGKDNSAAANKEKPALDARKRPAARTTRKDSRQERKRAA
jgi:hypothetical protein